MPHAIATNFCVSLICRCPGSGIDRGYRLTVPTPELAGGIPGYRRYVERTIRPT